jgi:myo-inositol-1(or 4)-monophosphatase
MARETILPRYLRAVREHKADGSVLTEADLASQAALVERLPKLIMAPVLGEEMTAEEQGRVSGTRASMACGSSTPSTAPPTSPTASLSSASPWPIWSTTKRRSGWFTTRSPTKPSMPAAAPAPGSTTSRCRCAQPAERLKDAVAGVDFKRISHHLGDELAVRPPYYSQRNFGSSALEWCYVAAGRLDVYLHGGQMLWDYAAGRLILEEAGGSYSTLGGTPLTAGPAIKRSVIAAASPALFEQWRTWLHAHS